jgi:hypothetical protein
MQSESPYTPDARRVLKEPVLLVNTKSTKAIIDKTKPKPWLW